MTNHPLVSIITPSYNQAQFLEQTIESVLGQDYPRLEYILVDGSSTDGSVDIIRKYASRLAWWVSEPDGGQAEAINKGMQNARGEIVAWLNSDDLYLPQAVSRAVRGLQADPSAGLLYADVLAIDPAGRHINLLRYGNWGLSGLAAFHIIGQPSVFLRRSALDKAGLVDTSYHYLLDHHLWLRMAQVAGITYLPETLSAARFHSEAKNAAHPQEFVHEIARIRAWMDTQPGLADLLVSEQRRIQAGMLCLRAFYEVEAGNPHAALRDYRSAFSLDPASVQRAWRRVAYALLSLAGLGKLRSMYLEARRVQSSHRKDAPS